MKRCGLLKQDAKWNRLGRMPTYEYKARDEKGRERTGIVDAVSEEVAADLLKDYKLTVISLKLKKEGIKLEKIFSIFGGVSAKEKVVFSRQLATMINSGLPIVQALRILQEQVEKRQFKEVIFDLANQVEGGSTFSAALAKYPKVFSKVYINLIKSGEVSGKLDEVLLRLAEQLEKDYDLKSKIKGAMYYPAFIIIALVLVAIVMIIFVIPQLESLFREAGTELPFLTRILLAVSSFIKNYWWLVLVVIIGSIFGLKAVIDTKEGRKFWDETKIRLPVFGSLSKKMYMARFTRTLATLIAGGLPILDALNITSEVIGNVVYQEGIEEAASQVESGVPMAAPLRRNKNFPIMVSQMISVGEQTGKVDEILNKLADFFDSEVANMVKALSSLIEPILIIIMGIGVAILVLAIIMPIYNLAQVIT